MLDPAEGVKVAETFGADDSQVQRDHLLSHLLVVLGSQFADRLVFFGGTALARTHLPDGRLSEDLDLIAVTTRASLAAELERVLVTGVRREYGTLTWDPPLQSVNGATPAVLRTPDGLSVRIQLLDAAGYPRWPTEHRQLVNRYSDVPPVSFNVHTLESFAASKAAAWFDRRAPRDLYDLWGLANIDGITADAAALFARLGPTGHPPRGWMFGEAPDARDWATELAAQTRLDIEPAAALAVVRDAWERALPGP